ncbi:MAG: type IV secretion system protein, partial [Rickettsiales bacterium]
MFFLNFFTKYKNITKLLLISVICSTLSSCGEVGCNEAGEFYAKTYELHANPKNFDKSVVIKSYGGYGDKPESIEWLDTGLLYAGGSITAAISGHWVSNAPNFKTFDEIGKKLDHCTICAKEPSGADPDKPNIANNQCYCVPKLDNLGKIVNTIPEFQEKTINNEINDITTYSCNDILYQKNGDKCTCQNKPTSMTNYELTQKVIYSLNSSKKILNNGSLSEQVRTTPINQSSCRLSMGLGAYLSLYPPVLSENPNIAPELAYHMFSLKSFCPIKSTNGNCVDENGMIRTKFIWESPSQIPKNNASPPQYHEDLSRIKLALYDHFYKDNSGYYKIEFVGGVIQKEGDGIFASSVKLAEDFLFGSNDYNPQLMRREKKDGVAEFMFKAVLNDPVVKKVISISLVLYVTIYGLAFLSGMVDFGRKELMSRLLKFGLVVLFTNATSWQFYNGFVIQFFKGGMDSMVKVVTGIFESQISPTLGSLYLQADESSTSVHKKFIYVDMLVRDLISKPNINRVFGLLFTKGTEFLSIAYIPIILALICYFIYAVLDIAIKYLINLIKICFGLALGPVFILFSLFEKTKDMFKNWLSFMGSRAFEIILLFTILHPFLMIIDAEFKTMLDFKVCIEKLNNNYYPFNVPNSSPPGNRSVFNWAEFFLKIGALIFIMKTFADKTGYISGQLITIGGVSNADSVTEVGHGQSGFSLAGGIARGMAGIAKSAVTSKYTGGLAKYAIRLGISAGTKIGRAKFGTDRSLNERINDGFKAVGIRFRGARSLMRDAKIDEAINKASASADSQKLTGTDREAFIRAETSKSLNNYNMLNKNNSTLLGIDGENIKKRLDEKLIKQPMKQMIKEKAQQLKEQGIFGKEAQDLIKKDIEDWSKKNLSSTSQKKVAEFFKKSSIKHMMKSESTLSGGQAARMTEALISSGNVDQAKEFADKYRDNMTRIQMEQNVKKQDTLENGGKSAKFVRAVLNAFVAPGHVARMVYKGGELTLSSIKNPRRIAKNAKKFKYVAFNPTHLKDHHWNESKIGQSINKVLGKVENKGTDARRWLKSFQIPFLNEGGAKSNPHKALRKFDRKMARMLSRQEDFKSGDKIDDVRKKFGLEDEQKVKSVKGLGVVGEFGKVRADDTMLTTAGKILISPITKPVNTIAKIVNDRFGEGKKGLKEYHQQQKTEALGRLANEMINDVNGKRNPFGKIFDEDLEKSKNKDSNLDDATKRFERTAKKEEARNAKKLLEETLKKLDDKSKKDNDKDNEKKTLFEKIDKESRSDFQKEMKRQMNLREEKYLKDNEELKKTNSLKENLAQKNLDELKTSSDIIKGELLKLQQVENIEKNTKSLDDLKEKLKSTTADEEKQKITSEISSLEQEIKKAESTKAEIFRSNNVPTHQSEDELKQIFDNLVGKNKESLNTQLAEKQKEIKEANEMLNLTKSNNDELTENLKKEFFNDLDYLSGAILKSVAEIKNDISSGRQIGLNVLQKYEDFSGNSPSSAGSDNDSSQNKISSPSTKALPDENSSKKTITEEIVDNFIEA